MNALLCVYAVILSCLMVVAEPTGTQFELPKNRNPPLETSHPKIWKKSPTQRQFYLYSKNDFHIDISKNGRASGSFKRQDSAVIVRHSGENQTVALYGKLAEKYLCVDSQLQVYTTSTLNEKDCLFMEEFHSNNYNSYRNSYHSRGDKNIYLSVDDNGTIRVANGSMYSIYFLTLEASMTVTSKDSVTSTSSTTTTTTATTTTTKVPPNIRGLEATRKRRRRWCKYLLMGKLQRNPKKYTNRCVKDCHILEKMVNDQKRYRRKCEKQKRKRRLRKRKLRDRGQRRRRPTRHHHGDGRKRRTRKHRQRSRKHRQRSRKHKRTPSVVTDSSQTHSSEVT